VKTDVYPETQAPPDASPETTRASAPQVLIPEVRQHARRRRLRNLGLVLTGAAIAAALFIFLGSGSPAGRQSNGSGSAAGSGALRSGGRTVTLRRPQALAVGPTGQLYVSDGTRNQILMRLPDGRFRVVAGTGVIGYSGDGGLATKAKVWAPNGLAVAPDGVIYFSQQARVWLPNKTTGSLSYVTVIRKIARNGQISTVVGRHPSCKAVGSLAGSMAAKSARVLALA
jgi:hypothetical protein